MSIITLTSDYGTLDYRVASTKGSILQLNKDIRIVDITHDIEAYNLKQTSYILRNAYPYFPDNTVHIISVDSFYQKEVKSLLYKIDNHYFIAADNGILDLTFPDIKPELIYEITFNNRFDDVVNFLSRDVFVPAAVHLCNGGLPEVIGRPYETPIQKKLPKAIINDNMIIGEVVYVDNFGNSITNIPRSLFNSLMAGYKEFTIKFRTLSLSSIYTHYSEFVTDWDDEPLFHGKSFAIFNEAQFLEICIYKGNKKNGAKTLMGIDVGEKVYIDFES